MKEPKPQGLWFDVVLPAEAMGFCSLISWGLDSVRGGSRWPPVLSNIMLVSMRGTQTPQDLWYHTSGMLQLWLRARCVGKTPFHVGHRHSHQLLWPPCQLPALLMGLVRLHSKVRPPGSGPLPLGGDSRETALEPPAGF